ncbi:Bacterial extracellular solute-binding protein, family 3 [Solimicrobium silvestre]|uniref:Bacterial extracellular solute-binding protein, family 3 n=2 Tax=Solimicrobium silvestre TaxID=2099400 RepID=A0A2S9GVX9_9BURK|nr:Bacterial extracellular solute-binding protein, family 3 [Solimicrobium silvestre]
MLANSLLSVMCHAGAVTNDAQAQDQLPRVIEMCDGIDEWPPYMYFKRINGEKSSEVVGYAFDYVSRILARKGIKATIKLIPWNRCVAEVESGKYAMLLDASNSEERDRKFFVSRTYYEVHLVYFYDLSRPKPQINSVADLKKFRLCGVLGYNYAPFLLEPENIDTGADGYDKVMAKLKLNRCDAVPDRLEVAIGFKTIGELDFIGKNIAYDFIPGVKSLSYHMLISRKLPYSHKLIELIDEGIVEINAHSGAADLAEKYGLR